MMLVMGAMAPDFAQQFLEGDITVPADKQRDLDALQRDADAITRLVIRGLLPESQGMEARKKLEKRICSLLNLVRA
jgi:hypothetical protein